MHVTWNLRDADDDDSTKTQTMQLQVLNALTCGNVPTAVELPLNVELPLKSVAEFEMLINDVTTEGNLRKALVSFERYLSLLAQSDDICKFSYLCITWPGLDLLRVGLTPTLWGNDPTRWNVPRPLPVNQPFHVLKHSTGASHEVPITEKNTNLRLYIHD